MKVSLNFTGRKRINKSLVSLQADDKGLVRLTVSGELVDLPSGQEHYCVLESFDKHYYSRMEKTDLGSIWDLQKNSPIKVNLDNFPGNPSSLKFRLMVCAPDGSILGATRNNLRLDSGEESGFISVVSAPLDGEICKLDFSGSTDSLELQIAESLFDDRSGIIHNPVFRGVVVPFILRSALSEADNYPHSSWGDKFNEFASGLLDGKHRPNDRPDLDDWIDEAVSVFCKKHDFHTKFIEGIEL